jgi:cardiolipin synthase
MVLAANGDVTSEVDAPSAPVAAPSRRRRWPIVVLIVVMVIAVGLFLAQDKRTVRARSAVPVGSADFADYVAALVGAPVTRGDSYQVLQNGDEIYPAMLDAIAGATRRIGFETYNFVDGRVGEQFAQALIDAANRGVAVRVVLDAVGAAKAPRDLETRFLEAGVQTSWFNRLGIWTFEHTNYRTHRKLLVVDGEVGFTGGAGVADHWLGHAQDPDHWRDTHFRVTGPIVRLLEAAFYDNWIETGSADPPYLDLAEPPGPSGARSILIWSNASGGVNSAKLLYLYSIAAARQTVDIQSPYFVGDSSIRWALEDALGRGVAVRILTDGDHTDAMSVKHASRAGYQALLDAGARLFEYSPTMMHVKAMIVDGTWSVIGSANFDNRSLELNDEITIGAYDPALAATLTAALGQDLSRSQEITRADWPRRPWHRKLRERFWSMFAEVF